LGDGSAGLAERARTWRCTNTIRRGDAAEVVGRIEEIGGRGRSAIRGIGSVAGNSKTLLEAGNELGRLDLFFTGEQARPLFAG